MEAENWDRDNEARWGGGGLAQGLEQALSSGQIF